MMTSEQKRERLLKRVLPALGITVVYFVFVSHIMVEQKTKAEESFNQLNMQGISRDAIPGIQSQTDQFSNLVNELKNKKVEHQKQIEKMAAFVAKNGSATESTTQLATILAKHQVRVVQDEHRELKAEDLSPALKDIKKLLLPNDPIKVQHLELVADYLSMYNALKEMNEVKLQAMPVDFTMSSPKDTVITRAGELLWTLEMWI